MRERKEKGKRKIGKWEKGKEKEKWKGKIEKEEWGMGREKDRERQGK